MDLTIRIQIKICESFTFYLTTLRYVCLMFTAAHAQPLRERLQLVFIIIGAHCQSKDKRFTKLRISFLI